MGVPGAVVAVQSPPMRLALAQLNPTVGDVAGNTGLVLDAIDAARRDGADVLVAGELGLIGYPPRDLLFRHGVVEACEQAVQQIAEHAGDLTVIVGHPRHSPDGERPFRNSASVCSNGQVLAVYDKRLFPGYDVFDEDRYFEPGQSTCIVEVAGQRVGVLICEDLWRAQDALAERRYPLEPARETIQAGCDVLISLNATPFVLGKGRTRLGLLRRWARSLSAPIVAVHQVGANDDLIFDGHSVAVAGDGSVIEVLPGWEPFVRTIELGPDTRGSDAATVHAEPMHELWSALVLGVKDYCRKTGNEQVVLGLSGGLDSSVTACIGAAALGVGNVLGLLLPSRYSSPESEEDAKQLESNVGLPPCPTIAIESVHLAVHNALAAFLGQRAGGVTDENIQARVRGVLLMAFTNANGALLLATANKSELATGYTTLYGDMCGALAVLGDVVKTRVYELANWINANHEACGFQSPPIPHRSITKAPSAELRPNQTDQDTLPPYELLDQVVTRYIELEESAEQISADPTLDDELVRDTVRMIDRAQYKRDQSAIVLKVTPRAFGRGRPMPIAMKWDSGFGSQESEARQDESVQGSIECRP